MRIAKAQLELTKYVGMDSDFESEIDLETKDIPEAKINEKWEELIDKKHEYLRIKYEIPECVHIFLYGMGGALLPSDLAIFKRHLSAWVKGKLTEYQCKELHFRFEECEEADWGWIMLERPLPYYDLDTENNPIEVLEEMKSIGTRSKKKTKLPELV